MHPLLITHGAFDDVALVNLEICAVDILAVMGSIAPIMIAFVHEFIVNGAVAPLDVVNPQSHAVAFEEITHWRPTQYSKTSAMRSSARTRLHGMHVLSSKRVPSYLPWHTSQSFSIV